MRRPAPLRGDDAVGAHPPSDDHKTTKNQLAMNGTAIDQIAGGKAVESWGAFDNMSVLVSPGYPITPPNK
jgi:hypothetical protein